VVSVTDPYFYILGFLDRSRFFLFKVLFNCIHESEWTPFQTHYFSENLAGIEPGTFGSVARNFDHYTTEAVNIEQ
jgi:hypothetical protein